MRHLIKNRAFRLALVVAGVFGVLTVLGALAEGEYYEIIAGGAVIIIFWLSLVAAIIWAWNPKP